MKLSIPPQQLLFPSLSSPNIEGQIYQINVKNSDETRGKTI